MKIRFSLRLYFLAVMLLLATTMVVSYSLLSANYFVKGLDAVLQKNMAYAAHSAIARDGQPATILDYHIATRWQDVPDNIRQHIPNPPSTPDKLSKHIVYSGVFSPPKTGYFGIMTLRESGEKYYVTHSFGEINQQIVAQEITQWPFFWIAITAFITLILFAVLLLVMTRSVTRPVENLGIWAKSLDAESINHSPPDFRYNELNKMAQIIRDSFDSTQKSLQREHDFLRHASHELRTPITVIKSNVELFKKINDPSFEKQNNIIERIERAELTMSDLCETLLWLSREEEAPLPTNKVALDKLLQQLVDELRYLLQGKPVNIHLELTAYEHQLPLAPCQIVLSNLIRNAFEHTQEGDVYIKQVGSRIDISNKNVKPQQKSSESSFGLGLKLTKKLTRRFHWLYKNHATDYGHQVEVDFEDN